MITIYISKSDSNLNVDWDNMPENAKAHIISYGLRQKLNDAGSAATTKELGKDEAGKQALSMAENVLSALMAGNVTVRQASVSMTIEEREFNKIVKALYKKAIGKPDTDFDHEEGLKQLAQKLGKSVDTLTAAIQLKAEANAEVVRKVQALKAESDIDIEL